MATLAPGDTYLGMNLSHGGHLTHGSPVNFSGKLYNVIPYGVRKSDHLIDYDEVRELALKHRPRLIMVGASAYPRKIDFAKFRAIADEIDAKIVAGESGTTATAMTRIGVASIESENTASARKSPAK